MKIIEYIKFIFYLIIISAVAVYGLSYSFYGLMVHVQDSSIYEFDIDIIDEQNLTKHRNIKVVNSTSAIDPLIYEDEYGQPQKYIYALIPKGSQIDATDLIPSKIIVESKQEITYWGDQEIQGLLEAYWYDIDQEVVNYFEYFGVQVSEDTVYLTLNSKLWKWYWHLLIIFVALLYFYRMFEALFKKVKGVEDGAAE